MAVDAHGSSEQTHLQSVSAVNSTTSVLKAVRQRLQALQIIMRVFDDR
jgi:hypothetical protein